MVVVSNGRNLVVNSKLIPDRSNLFSYTHKKDSSIVNVEDCLVNDMLLREAIPGLELFSESIRTIDKISEIENINDDRLKDYQKADIKKMVETRYCLNRNGMGLGKTVEAVMLMKTLGISSGVIVAPKSVLYQWFNTFKEWYPEVLDNVFINKTNPSKGDLLIYNYEKLTSGRNILYNIISLGTQEIVICDEAHRIKNINSMRSKAVNSLPSKRRLALTGTPITSKPNDLYGILYWLHHRYVGRSYWRFVEYFCELEDNGWGNVIKGLTKNEKRVATLRKLLDIVSVHNELEVAEGKSRITVKLKMNKNQEKLYNNAKKLILDELPETLTIANGAVLATRLQQITSYPALFSDKNLTYGPGAKFEWIKDLLDDNPDEKIVVFTRFATTALHLATYLGNCCVAYTGYMQDKVKQNNKKLFIEDDKIRVIVGTIGAMGEGVDGLQLASRVAVFIDREWVPSAMEQCEDRLNRMGQTKPVICYYLECDKTFDQHVGNVNLSKAEDIRRVLSDG